MSIILYGFAAFGAFAAYKKAKPLLSGPPAWMDAYYTSRLSEFGKGITKSLDNSPEDWHIGDCRATHKNGLELWIGISPHNCKLYSEASGNTVFNFYDKRLIWKRLEARRKANELTAKASLMAKLGNL